MDWCEKCANNNIKNCRECLLIADDPKAKPSHFLIKSCDNCLNYEDKCLIGCSHNCGEPNGDKAFWKSKDTTSEVKVVSKKPPIGVIPKQIFVEERIKELTRALFQYSQFGIKKELMVVWANELVDRIYELEK